jgi:uncharacterized protein (TIGR03435 family)
MKKFWRIAILLALACGLGRSQTPAPAAPQFHFEVASIRMVEDHDQEMLARGIQPMSWSRFPTNRFYAHSMPLSALIGMAYEVDGKNITGEPNWLDSQHYDVDARVEGDRQLTYEEIKPLLQDLLAQRFHLVVHQSTKMTSGYAMIVGKGGAKLQASSEGVQQHAQVLPNGFQVWHMDAKGIATVVSIPAGGPVADKTGLTGTYDVKLSYAPPNDPSSNLPSFFTALQEQLGLKLESDKVPVEMLVIDHVDKIPTEN